MGTTFRVLIADRNGHVRDFLKRELGPEGYDVALAKDGREVLAAVAGPGPPDVLVMDLLLPFVDGLLILEQLHRDRCPVPVIIYTSLTEYQSDPAVQSACAFIEKEAELTRLKSALSQILRQTYPARASSIPSLSKTSHA